MTQEELFAIAIGIQEPWYIESINLDIPSMEAYDFFSIPLFFACPNLH